MGNVLGWAHASHVRFVFTGAGSRNPQKQYAEVLTILEGVHGKLEAEQPSSNETAAHAHKCMRMMLRALVLPQ